MSTLLSYSQFPKEPVMLENLSIKFMKQSLFVPLSLIENSLHIAMADPSDRYTVDALKMAYGYHIKISKGKQDDIIETIERLYGSGSQSIETIIEEAGKDIFEIQPNGDTDINHLRDLASEAPIIRLVNRLILSAIEMKASDIHFEPFEKTFKARYRIDGILHEAESPPPRLQAAIISRVKIMAKLDIAERRLPQDGRIEIRIGNKNIFTLVKNI